MVGFVTNPTSVLGRVRYRPYQHCLVGFVTDLLVCCREGPVRTWSPCHNHRATRVPFLPFKGGLALCLKRYSEGASMLARAWSRSWRGRRLASRFLSGQCFPLLKDLSRARRRPCRRRAHVPCAASPSRGGVARYSPCMPSVVRRARTPLSAPTSRAGRAWQRRAAARAARLASPPWRLQARGLARHLRWRLSEVCLPPTCPAPSTL